MKKIMYAILCAAVTLLTLAAVQRLLTPKYMSGEYSGALIGEYYAEDKSHQVVFIGDCEFYENISPVTLWEEYGVTSYIRGSAQQLIWQSYYLLEETLKYEKPDVVAFSVLAMKYDTPQKEEFNRLTLDGMKLSAAKLGAVSASMTAGEDPLSYLFPLLRYHERWKELGAEDFHYFFGVEKVSHNGFMMRCDVRPVNVVPVGQKLPSYEFGENSWYWLDKMTELCRREGVEFLLIKAPSLYPYWYDEWNAQIVRYAEENGLAYLNALALADRIGLDFSADTYDAGLHLNLYGAEKLSLWLGGVLRERYRLADRRGDPGLASLWAEKSAAYDRQRDAQTAELAEFGEIKTFLVN